jgi:uncharacterized membrane protein YedE/YeeE
MSLSPTIIALASFFAALFGFSLVRGGVCTLAAVEELVLERKWRRLQGLAELWLWIIAFFLTAYFACGIKFTSTVYAATLSSLIGGVLLGLGAFINQACPFGTIVAIGSGYWSYIATPIGLFVGSVIHFRHLSFLSPRPTSTDSLLFTLSPFVLIPIVGVLSWRLTRLVLDRARSESISNLLRHAWSPLVASLFVAISFSALILLAGGWTYTQLLADLASNRYELIGERLLLFVAMFSGALAGGLTDKGWCPKPATLRGLLCCFTGGFIMGIGHKLVPGAHDSLTLIGQPLLMSYAWVSMGVIYLTLAFIYATIKIRRRLRR